MSWNEDKGTARVVSDSKGNPHYIIFQELQMSCGPASVAMVESQYKLACMVNPEGRARELSQNWEGRWTAEGGTMASNLSYILNAEGVKTYAATHTTKLWDYFSYYVKETTPMICHIAWTSGGHFVVCKKVYSDGTIVFLDPWYGLVEVQYANLPKYTPPGASGQLSGWLNVTYR
jgi:predicted double-glycine peptidase